MNYVQKPTQYSIKVEMLGKQPAATGKGAKVVGDFTVDSATLNAPAADSKDGVEVPVNVTFEPSSPDESRAIMTLKSNEGGEYQCYLIGSTLSPQPKGPFNVRNFRKGKLMCFRQLEKQSLSSSKILSTRPLTSF